MAFKAGYDKLNGYKYELAIIHQGMQVEQGKSWLLDTSTSWLSYTKVFKLNKVFTR